MSTVMTPGQLSLVAVDAVRNAQSYFATVTFDLSTITKLSSDPVTLGQLAAAQQSAQVVTEQLAIALKATAQLNNDIG